MGARPGLLERVPAPDVTPDQARWVAANTGSDLAAMLGYTPYQGHDRAHGHPTPQRREPQFRIR